MIFLVLLGIVVVVAFGIFLIWNGLGQPHAHPHAPKFDDIPADVQKLDSNP